MNFTDHSLNTTSKIDEKVLSLSTRQRILYRLQETQYHSPFLAKHPPNKVKGVFVPKIQELIDDGRILIPSQLDLEI